MTDHEHIHDHHGHHHGHVHHEHEHHDHGADCTCEHCQYSHNGVIFHLSTDVHDGASVASARGTLEGHYDAISQTIRSVLKQLADQINGTGGIVGHIKSALEIHRTEGYSITLDTVHAEIPDTVRVEITLNAIVFGIDTEQLEGLLKDSLRQIAETHCPF